MIRVYNSQMNDVSSLYKKNKDAILLSVLNITDKNLRSTVDTKYYAELYRELFIISILISNPTKRLLT